MRYPNSDFLRAQFRKDGSPILAGMDSFEIDIEEWTRHLADISVGSQEDLIIQHDRAAYRCLTFHQAKGVAPKGEVLAFQEVLAGFEAKQLAFQHRVFAGIGLIVVIQVIEFFAK